MNLGELIEASVPEVAALPVSVHAALANEYAELQARTKRIGATLDAALEMAYGGKNEPGTSQINKTTVSKKRREMGLPANDTRFTPTDAQLADLRTMSNHAMERKYGNSADTWSRLRRRYGIDPFRLPTVRDGVPVSPLTGEVIEDKPKPEVSWAVVQNCFSGLAPRRPGGIAYDAAAFLQSERYAVFNRKKLGLGEGWQVGRVSMSEADMIAKAERIKARRMGVAA